MKKVSDKKEKEKSKEKNEWDFDMKRAWDKPADSEIVQMFHYFPIHEGIAPQEKEPDDKPSENQCKYNTDM